MPRELARSLGDQELRARLWTLKDKDSLFRAKNDDVHIVEISAKKKSDGVVIMLERQFNDYTQAKAYYENFLRAFGHSLQFIKRTKSP
jgi:hypothetical protein